MSSDYDDDDLLLDDDALRKLSEVEDKCGVAAPQGASHVSNAAPVLNLPKRGENPPPQKRAKVAPPVLASLSDEDDTPDIFVNADGTYALDSPGPSVVSLAPSFIHPGTARRVASESVPHHSVSPAIAPARPSNQNGGQPAPARSLRRNDSSASIQVIEAPPTTQGIRPLIRAGSLSQAISRGLARNGTPLTQQQSQSQMQVDSGLHDPDANFLQNEVKALRAQLARAESERESLRTSLQQNKEATFAKAGEAENLRRTMKEISRLRQDMIEMEKAKATLEARMKQEMDQIRTSMTFRQHEIGTSRKGFPNVNSTIKKRQVMGSSHTPGSTQGFSRALELQSSPLSPTKRSTRKQMGPPEKSFSKLTNSFARSTSPAKARLRPKSLAEDTFDGPGETSVWPGSSRIQGKGKEKASNAWKDDEDQNAHVRSLKFEEPEYWRSHPIPATQAPFAIEPDVFGASSLPKTPMKSRAEGIPSMEVTGPIDLADEVSRSNSFANLNVDKFSPATAFSGSIVPSTGDTGENSAWDHAATKASLALAQLAQVFQEGCLVCISLARYLLEAGVGDQDSLILAVLCDTIIRFFKKPSDSGEVWHLAESILGLFESLASYAKDDCAIKFSILSHKAEVLSILLDPAQPPPWTVRVTPSLELFTGSPLARTLLNFSEANASSTREIPKVPLLECICRHLVAFRKHNINEHYRELYENILTALAQFAIADNQSLKTLVDSPSLLLSLVSFIYNVTSTIWSEVALAENATGNHEIWQNLRSAVQLLHYLVFTPDPMPNVRERLIYATRSPFNGSIHFFIVSFGRLAFGDPPDYLDTTCAKAIRGIRGLSEALLETVVDGPEVDGIYTVFRDSDEDENIPSSGEKVEPSVADEEEALRMVIDDEDY
ncbi:hypothetical protein AG1IA_03492 [Rhizoctonia solani AG-1 IA]|uniref:Uncharacterized protein n=1 Tax=Thanatephorus cucumeris (strain AG1-IA) TaxID=983506 RepID=L8X061_THACA|nr:hypothetical protein AG1IA_03492 [Rhizoctonia solani AG-1 IA]